MKFWLMIPWTLPEDMMELAVIAEDLGFEGVMGADHAFLPRHMAENYPYTADGKPPIHGELPYPDVWTSIAAMAAVTTTLKFSTAVYVLPLRHPIEIAKAAATIARISNNRLVIGAGVGWMKEEFDTYGVDFSTRGKRMDETIEVLHKLWDGGYVEHHGHFFDFDELQLAPAPEHRVPIYIGGASKPALRRAGRVAEGWMGNGNTPAEMPDIFASLKAARVEAGRADQPFEIILALKEMLSVDQAAEYREQGATGMFLGVPDASASVAEKRQLLEKMSGYMRSVAA